MFALCSARLSGGDSRLGIGRSGGSHWHNPLVMQTFAFARNEPFGATLQSQPCTHRTSRPVRVVSRQWLARSNRCHPLLSRIPTLVATLAGVPQSKPSCLIVDSDRFCFVCAAACATVDCHLINRSLAGSGTLCTLIGLVTRFPVLVCNAVVHCCRRYGAR